MNFFYRLFLLTASIFLLVTITACKEKEKEKETMDLSQKDINLLIEHKKEIDAITAKFDKMISKSSIKKKTSILLQGKKTIDEYLKSKKLDPSFFMRKSKKILKGYIAFYYTGPEILAQRKKMLEAQNLTKKEFDANIKAFKKEKKLMFNEFTVGLSEYEIELIRSNLKNIASVVKSK